MADLGGTFRVRIDLGPPGMLDSRVRRDSPEGRWIPPRAGPVNQKGSDRAGTTHRRLQPDVGRLVRRAMGDDLEQRDRPLVVQEETP